MAKVRPGISDELAAWLLAQPVFFVGTAPAALDGHVNVSPKGMSGTFTVLDAHRVAYLDHSGSGAETIAHLMDFRGDRDVLDRAQEQRDDACFRDY